MSGTNHDTGFSFYIPIVLITAFLLGCFSLSLMSIRENASSILPGGAVSDGDSVKSEGSVRKSPVYNDGGLKYRLVSASDLGIGNKSISQPDDPAPKRNVSSQAEQGLTDGVLRLPMEHYINFVPHRSGYMAYLTFDDGPSENTEAILDILDYYNVKATFFVIYHKDMEDKYKAIVNAGHTIALHSYTHDYSSVYASEASFFNEMDMISDYIYRQTGVRTMLMRFPGGSSNTISRKYSRGLMSVLKKSVKERGYVYQDWNVDSCDAEKPYTPPEKLFSNVSNSVGDKKTVIVLMHDSGNKTATTVQALPEIIEFFFAKGYSMEKLDMTVEEIHHNW